MIIFAELEEVYLNLKKCEGAMQIGLLSGTSHLQF